MGRITKFLFFFIISVSAFAQKEKLAEKVIESFAKKDYKILFPYLIPDSYLVKESLDSSGKADKITVESLLIFRMIEQGHWKDYLKQARRSKINFKNLVIKEVIFSRTSLHEGDIYIHYTVGERQGLLQFMVAEVGVGLYISFFGDVKNGFMEQEGLWIEEQKKKYRDKEVNQ